MVMRIYKIHVEVKYFFLQNSKSKNVESEMVNFSKCHIVHDYHKPKINETTHLMDIFV